jgi:hypothetical protein
MSNIKSTASAFVNQKKASCHNATTDGRIYNLFGNPIAEWVDGSVIINWCGWYTPTTAAHLNNILSALGKTYRVSYSQAKKEGATWSIV